MKYDFDHMGDWDVIGALQIFTINTPGGPQLGGTEDDMCMLMNEAATRIRELLERPVCRCKK